MKICDLFDSGRPLFSFEFFPPKTDQGAERLHETIAELGTLQPAFVSVTYGAGGSTRDRTIELVTRIQDNAGITAMAHLTCVGAGKAEIGAVVDRLAAGGIENIIALRGDPPAGSERFEVPPDGFAHASELVRFIRTQHDGRLCVAAAAYPEGHVECRDLALDLRHLKAKVDAGVDFLVTQLFFDNQLYYDFVGRARAAGIKVPIVAGLMPILNVAQIERFTRMCGASIPAALHAELDRHRDDNAAIEEIGVAHARKQAADLLKNGVPGIHFYTLNKSAATRTILTDLRRAGIA